MRLKLKKCIHLMVILLALVETFTGAIVDCVVYTIFYQTSLEPDSSSASDCYFTAHLLPTKHFYRLIIVLYVPILYLWRSHGVSKSTGENSEGATDTAHGHSRVLSVFYTRFPQPFVSSSAGWLWHWLRALQSTNAGVPLADDSDTGYNWWWTRKPLWYRDGKSCGELVDCRGRQHDSVIKQYNTRVCCIYFYCFHLHL